MGFWEPISVLHVPIYQVPLDRTRARSTTPARATRGSWTWGRKCAGSATFLVRLVREPRRTTASRALWWRTELTGRLSPLTTARVRQVTTRWVLQFAATARTSV